MNECEPKIEIYCLYKDKTEQKLTLDIDLSYDPLLGKPYVKEWITHLIKKNFNLTNNIEYINICQTNIQLCKEYLPYWYYELEIFKNEGI